MIFNTLAALAEHLVNLPPTAPLSMFPKNDDLPTIAVCVQSLSKVQREEATTKFKQLAGSDEESFQSFEGKGHVELRSVDGDSLTK